MLKRSSCIKKTDRKSVSHRPDELLHTHEEYLSQMVSAVSNGSRASVSDFKSTTVSTYFVPGCQHDTSEEDSDKWWHQRVEN
jgi:hypothetical protein